MLAILVSAILQGPSHTEGNRHASLQTDTPYAVGLPSAKLVTPQWIGEEGVDAAIVLTIDDMSQPERYEQFLRPILDRLKEIDGRAPISIFTNNQDPHHPQLASWLEEGLSFEVHTLHHPCPCLQNSDFETARWTVHGGIERLYEIPNSEPVAYRMPCCDSMNSVSPRFFAEIFARPTDTGRFLSVDSSVFCLFTAEDHTLEQAWLFDEDGRERFRKYVPYDRRYANSIENYPYPYVIQKTIWQIPAVIPSDWAAQHRHGVMNPQTVTDWKRALDIVVAKQGIYCLVFHPHAWISSDQLIELIDYAVDTYGSRVKFLQCAEVEERLRENLLVGHSLQNEVGGDGGARLLDLDADGYLDVVIGRDAHRLTRRWDSQHDRWIEQPFVANLAAPTPSPETPPTTPPPNRTGGSHFAVLDVSEDEGGSTVVLAPKNGGLTAWRYDDEGWVEAPELALPRELREVTVSEDDRDTGVRFWDLDRDGSCECLIANPGDTAVLSWSATDGWTRRAWTLPEGLTFVDDLGRDAGLRLTDVDRDGDLDLVFADATHSSVHLFQSMEQGWTEVWKRTAGDEDALRPFVLADGTNGGGWFHQDAIYWQTEETAALPGHVDSRAFRELLPSPSAPVPDSQAPSTFALPSDLRIALAASAPLLKDPVAFDWSSDGRFWGGRDGRLSARCRRGGRRPGHAAARSRW